MAYAIMVSFTLCIAIALALPLFYSKLSGTQKTYYSLLLVSIVSLGGLGVYYTLGAPELAQFIWALDL